MVQKVPDRSPFVRLCFTQISRGFLASLPLGFQKVVHRLAFTHRLSVIIHTLLLLLSQRFRISKSFAGCSRVRSLWIGFTRPLDRKGHPHESCHRITRYAPVPYCTPRTSPLFQYRPSIPERVSCAPGATSSD